MNLIEFNGKKYPSFQAEGFAAQYIFPFARKFWIFAESALPHNGSPTSGIPCTYCMYDDVPINSLTNPSLSCVSKFE